MEQGLRNGEAGDAGVFEGCSAGKGGIGEIVG